MLLQRLEKAPDHVLGHAREYTLPDAGDHPADFRAARITQQGVSLSPFGSSSKAALPFMNPIEPCPSTAST